MQHCYNIIFEKKVKVIYLAKISETKNRSPFVSKNSPIFGSYPRKLEPCPKIFAAIGLKQKLI